MYKQFEGNSNTGEESLKDEQQKESEKRKFTFECSEGPMKKQMKFCTNEQQFNPSFSSISTNALQPPVKQLKDIFSVPLDSEQGIQILSELKEFFETHSEIVKQMNLCTNEGQSNSMFLSNSNNALQFSGEQFRNEYSIPFYNQQSSENLSKSKPNFETFDERTYEHTDACANEGQFNSGSVFKTYNERSFTQMNFSISERQSSSNPIFKTVEEDSMKERNFYDSIRHSNSTALSSSNNLHQPSVKHFLNMYSEPLYNEQSAKNVSKSEPVFKTLDEIPFDQINFHASQRPSTSEPVFKTIDESPFKQINSHATEACSSSAVSQTSTNMLQLSMERFMNTNSISLHKELQVQILSKSQHVFKTPIKQCERLFEQVKLCANKEQSTSESMSTLSDVLQFKHSASLHNEQEDSISSESKQISEIPSFNHRGEQYAPFQIKDIFIEREKEIRIVSALGLPLIKKFAEIAKKSINRFSMASHIIHFATSKLKLGKHHRYEISVDPDSPTHVATFCSKFFLKECLVATEISHHRKKAKQLSAEAAVNTLVKLATLEKCKPVIKYRPTTCKNYSPMQMLELFSKNIINRIKDEPAIITFKSIASLLDMEKFIEFIIVSNVVSETITEYTCKFFINGILIAYATDETDKSAKNVAAELGLIKLSNLKEYAIHRGELKKIHCNNKTIYSDILSSSKRSPDVGLSDLKKPSFILNKTLYDSSLNDGILVIERERQRINVNKALLSLIYEAATFCQKECSMDAEDIGNTQYRKVKVSIGGVEVGVGVAYSNSDAKTVACTKAFINMKKKYYTLKVKDGYIQGFLVYRDQIFKGEPYFKNVLRNNYIECQKVKRGVFRINLPERNTSSPTEITADQSSDINENAKPPQSHHDFQLFESNLKVISKEDAKNENANSPQKYFDIELFRNNLEAMLKEFKESEDYCDLLFSEDFFSKEKLEILKISRRLQMRFQWLIADGDHKLTVVRHRYEVPKLLNYLVKNGGCNCKFQLIDGSTEVI